MSQTLLDLGVTQNAINLGKAKAREALDANLEARKARQVSRGMKDGFDFTKVEGMAIGELLEKREKSRAEDAAQATAPKEEPKVEAAPEAPATEEPK